MHLWQRQRLAKGDESHHLAARRLEVFDTVGKPLPTSCEQHVDMHVIQRILGHAQVTTTRIYTDPTDSLTREAAIRIGRVLWPDGD
jgi:integrase